MAPTLKVRVTGTDAEATLQVVAGESLPDFLQRVVDEANLLDTTALKPENYTVVKSGRPLLTDADFRAAMTSVAKSNLRTVRITCVFKKDSPAEMNQGPPKAQKCTVNQLALLVASAQTNVLLFSAQREILHLFSLSRAPTAGLHQPEDSVWKELYHRDCPEAAGVKLQQPALLWQDVYFRLGRGRALPFDLWKARMSTAKVSRVEEYRTQETHACLFSQALSLAADSLKSYSCYDYATVISWLFGDRGLQSYFDSRYQFLEDVYRDSLTTTNEAELNGMLSAACTSIIKTVCVSMSEELIEAANYGTVEDGILLITHLLEMGADANTPMEKGPFAYDSPNTTMLHAIPCFFIDVLFNERGGIPWSRSGGGMPVENLQHERIVKLMKILLSHGADCEQKDDWGNSPLQVLRNLADHEDNKSDFEEVWSRQPWEREEDKQQNVDAREDWRRKWDYLQGLMEESKKEREEQLAKAGEEQVEE
jgi:hypothetical protein